MLCIDWYRKSSLGMDSGVLEVKVLADFLGTLPLFCYIKIVSNH